jgi:hypothetical protein
MDLRAEPMVVTLPAIEEDEDGNGGGNQTAGAYLYGLDVRSIRTQLMNASHLDRVREIQSSYKAQPLSPYLHQKPPQTPPKIDYPPIDSTTFEPQF